MTALSRKLNPLVGLNDDGSNRFFKAVSSRAAFELGVSHPLGARSGSDDRSARPGSFNDFYYDFYVNDRAINWNAYSTPATPVPMEFLSGDKILLGSFEPCSVIGSIDITRSNAASLPAQFIGMGDQEPLECLGADGLPNGMPLLVNDCLNNSEDAAWADFPEFNLYLTELSKPQDPSKPMSYPSIKLMPSANIIPGKSSHYEITTASLQMTDNCPWILWMKLAGDAPAHSGMSIWGSRLTDGK